ncbi:tail fiber protein [Pectobacterium phage PP74]|uniref:Tail fiber protein n=1 Tax=Pectobacterium phage PP74 TaxID=1916101 RepID=A0A1J0MEW1_9CAUD|nr:tail fiber protein [Pectobacterium phage PP74]APD19656.1 tail fiber protein [Pectobacterium phage PP74]
MRLLSPRDEAEQFKNTATASATASATSAAASADSAAYTYTWRNEAAISRDEAEQFKNTATASADSAANSAAASADSATYTYTWRNEAAISAAASADSAILAEHEAAKLGNMNDFAGAIQSVDNTSNNVHMKGAVIAEGVLQSRNPDGECLFAGAIRVGGAIYTSGKVQVNDEDVVTKSALKNSEFAWNSSLVFPGESDGLNIFRKSGEHSLGTKYNGAIEVRPMAGWDIASDLGRSPMITFHWPGKAACALFMTESGELAWGAPDGTWNKLSNTRQMSGGNALRGWRVDPANPSVAEVWGYTERVPADGQVNINIIPDTGFPYTPVSGGVILVQASNTTRAGGAQANTVTWWVQQGSVFGISYHGARLDDSFFWTAKINFQY